VESNAATRGSFTHEDHGIVTGLRQIEIRWLQLHTSCLDLGEIEDVVDE